MRDASDHDEKAAAAAQSASDQRTEQLTDNEQTGQPGGEPAGQPGDKLTEQPGGEPTGQPGGEATELSRLRAENVELRDKLTAPRRHRVRHTFRAIAAV